MTVQVHKNAWNGSPWNASEKIIPFIGSYQQTAVASSWRKAVQIRREGLSLFEILSLGILHMHIIIYASSEPELRNLFQILWVLQIVKRSMHDRAWFYLNLSSNLPLLKAHPNSTTFEQDFHSLMAQSAAPTIRWVGPIGRWATEDMKRPNNTKEKADEKLIEKSSWWRKYWNCKKCDGDMGPYTSELVNIRGWLIGALHPSHWNDKSRRTLVAVKEKSPLPSIAQHSYIWWVKMMNMHLWNTESPYTHLPFPELSWSFYPLSLFAILSDLCFPTQAQS